MSDKEKEYIHITKFFGIKDYIKTVYTFLFKKPQTGLYTYENYEEYKNTQIKGNTEKLNHSWVTEEDIVFLSEVLKKRFGKKPLKGICHGTRRGLEQKWFMENINGADVFGTDISHTAKQFPHSIEWDFHEVKEEWLNNFDFIYSNSFDHSYKPNQCLKAWLSCLNDDGVIILEWSNGCKAHNKLDCFGATKNEYIDLIQKHGWLIDILEHPESKGIKKLWSKKWTYYFIIKKKIN